MTTAQRIIKYCALAFAGLLIASIISGIIFALSLVCNIGPFSFGINDEDIKEMEIMDINLDNITSLDLDTGATTVNIKEADEFKIETNNGRIKANVKGNTLKIKEKSRIIFFGSTDNRAELNIYIPRNKSLDYVDIDAGAGKFNIDFLEAVTLDLDAGAGKINLNNLNISRETNIDGGAGSLTIKNSNLNNLDLDIGAGRTEISGILQGHSEIDAGVGSFDLNLIDSIDNYRISVEKGVGSINVNGDNIKNDTVIGNGNQTINLELGVGSVNITSNN